MGCLAFLLSLLTPRVVIVLLWLFSDYMGRAYEGALVPVLGLIFMPFTTLAYAFGKNRGGAIDGVYLVLMIVAVLVDLGVIGSGGAKARRRRR